MAFSAKAQEIHDYIVSISATDDWTDRAKSHLKPVGQPHSRPHLSRDVYAFVLELRAAFGNKFSAADDNDWEQIADWLFNHAQP